ncbi:MAG TPA: hypothetical protein VIX86_10830 [Streptosporangiaceae bacterium]
MSRSNEADQAAIAAMQAETDRVTALPLAQLAAEVMGKGFGPGGPGGPGQPGTLEAPTGNAAPRTTVGTIAMQFTPAYQARAVNWDMQAALNQILAEALQLLEHAALVRAEAHSNVGGLCYVATRRGRAALAAGEVERIVGG